MRRKQQSTLEEQLDLDYSRVLARHEDESGIITWTAENWIATVAVAAVGLAIVATMTAKPQAEGAAAPSSKPERPRKREPVYVFKGSKGVLSSDIPQPGGLLFPAREALSPRDVRDAILEAREAYE